MRAFITAWILFFSLQSWAQAPLVKFETLSRIKTWAFGRAYAYDGKRIIVTGGPTSSVFLYDYETYYTYSFDDNTWNKVNFPTKGIRKNPRGRPGNMSEYLPGKNIIITMGNPIEVLDLATFRMTVAMVDGAYPWSCGSAVWNDKIYFFGGTWISDDNAVAQYNRQQLFAGITDLCFSFESMAFQELSPMPDRRNVRGKFVKGKLYALGGNSMAQEFNDIFQYDPDSNRWSVKGYLPHAVSQNAIFSDGTLIYITGVDHDTGYLGIYDPGHNTYRMYATNIGFKHGALIVHENKLYFFAGHLPDDVRVVDSRLFRIDLGTLPPAKEYNCNPGN